jgi:hypothetical protein
MYILKKFTNFIFLLYLIRQIISLLNFSVKYTYNKYFCFQFQDLFQ